MDKKTKTTIVIICVALFGLYALWYFRPKIEEARQEMKQKSVADSIAKVTQQQAATINAQQPVIIGQTLNLYKFADFPDGLVPVSLSCKNGFWHIYPKGGKISVFDKNKKFICYDEPGKTTDWGSDCDFEGFIGSGSSSSWAIEVWR